MWPSPSRLASRFQKSRNDEREKTMHANYEVDWSEANLTTLRTMWSDGYSCSVISAKIPNSTRSAIIGKVHRLKLPHPAGKMARKRQPHSACTGPARRSSPLPRPACRPASPQRPRSLAAPQPVTQHCRRDSDCRDGAGLAGKSQGRGAGWDWRQIHRSRRGPVQVAQRRSGFTGLRVLRLQSPYRSSVLRSPHHARDRGAAKP